jgi:hypothetical protein
MEPGGSVTYSQDPATGPYPEPDESSLYLPITFLEDQFYYYPPMYA